MTPVAFHGRVLTLITDVGGVSSATLSLSPTPLQNNTLANSVCGRAFTGRELVTARREKKKKTESCMHRPAVIPLEVSLTAFLRVGEAKGKTCKSGGKKGGEMMLTLESPLFLFITRVRGPVIFTGRAADILISMLHF